MAASYSPETFELEVLALADRERVAATRPGTVTAGKRHLERWWRQVDDHGAALGTEFDKAGKVHDVAASRRVTTWAYENAEQARAQVWVGKGEFEVSAGWRVPVGL